MNQIEFVTKLQNQYRRDLTPTQTKAFCDSIGVFTDSELNRIFDPLTQKCRRMPVTADVFETAKEEHIGHSNLERATDRPHEWEPTDCPHCSGEGLVSLFWEGFYEHTDGALNEELKLEHVFPCSSALTQNVGTKDFIETLARCKCPAGRAPTLSRGWPVWDGRRRHRRNGLKCG